MANDQFRIIVNPSTKKAKFINDLFIRNTFDIIISNFGDADAADVALQIYYNGNIVALIDAGNLTLSSGNLTGELDLDTGQLVQFFSNRAANSYAYFDIVIQDTSDDDTILSDRVKIFNNVFGLDSELPAIVVSTFTGAIQGTDTIANILSKSASDGDLWICSDTDAGASVPGVVGDGYIWDADLGTWRNVGQIRGPQGVQGVQGIQGVQGEKGDIGDTGPEGPAGDISEYDSSKTYDLNNFCSYNGKFYVSRQNNNTGHQPDISGTWWSEYSSGGGGSDDGDFIAYNILFGGL